MQMMAGRSIRAGGCVTEANIYIEGSADIALLKLIGSNAELDVATRKFCYIIGPRQIGKSSLAERTIRTLERRGLAAVRADLSGFGVTDVTEAEWYSALLYRIMESLKLSEEYSSLSDYKAPLKGFIQALQESALRRHGRLVLFIDEVDLMIGTAFANGFISFVNDLYRGRYPGLSGLDIILVGNALPGDLASDDESKSLFDNGTWVRLNDFTRDDCASLIDLIGCATMDAAELVDRLYYWTEGAPYLVMRICRDLAVSQSRSVTASQIDEFVRQELIRPDPPSDPNVQEPMNHGLDCLREHNYLELYADLLQSGRVNRPADDQAALDLWLRSLCRLQDKGDGTIDLSERNPIFKSVYTSRWVNVRLTELNRDSPFRHPVTWDRSAPGSTSYSVSGYVSRPLEMSEALSNLEDAWTPVVVVGPRHIGKSCFIRQLLTEVGTAVATCYVDIETLTDEDRLDIFHFYKKLSLIIAANVGADVDRVDAEWERGVGVFAIRNVMSRIILPSMDRHLILALDQVDAIWQEIYVADVYRMFRNWLECSYDEPWNRLRMVFGVSIDPALLAQGNYGSPFNMTTAIRLNDFDSDQVKTLSRLSGYELDNDNLSALMAKLDGNPRLVNDAIAFAMQNGLAICESSFDEDGELYREVVVPYLSAIVDELRKETTSFDALENFFGEKDVRLDNDSFFRLNALGVLALSRRPHSTDGEASKLRCAVYDQYFRSIW